MRSRSLQRTRRLIETASSAAPASVAKALFYGCATFTCLRIVCLHPFAGLSELVDASPCASA
ncbi:hypothetical protein ACVWZR_005399 [Bradyrhizobium sp. i1.3.1]